MNYSICFLFIILISCGTKDHKSQIPDSGNLPEITSFERLDSVQINYLGNPTLHDLDPESGTVLFMEHKEFSEEIFIADFKGNILNSYSKFGDVPDSYGTLMFPLRLQRDQTIIGFGSNGFLIYDMSGDLQSRVKHKNFKMPYFARNAMGFGMEKFDDLYVCVNQEFPDWVSESDIRLYEEIYLMMMLNPETGERMPFIQFPKTSLFRNGKHFYRGAWEPVFAIDKELIYVIFGAEPTIYVYSLKRPYSFVYSIPLDLKDYRYFKGSDDNFSDLSLLFTSGKILNIKKLEGYFIVAYFPGYSKEDKEAEKENRSREEKIAFRQGMLKKYAKRIAIIDSLGKRVGDFIPEGLVAESMLIRNNELWMIEEPSVEVELNYFRLFRVGL